MTFAKGDRVVVVTNHNSPYEQISPGDEGKIVYVEPYRKGKRPTVVIAWSDGPHSVHFIDGENLGLTIKKDKKNDNRNLRRKRGKDKDDQPGSSPKRPRHARKKAKKSLADQIRKFRDKH